MLKSMTGFANISTTTLLGEMEIEIKSLNSKNLDLSIRLPKVLSSLEMDIREWIKEKISRGKISCYITINKYNIEELGEKLNHEMVKYYRDLLIELKDMTGITSEISLDNIMKFGDIFYTKDSGELSNEVKNEIKELFVKVLEKLNDSRIKEGMKLKKDFSDRIELLSELMGEIEKPALENPLIVFEKQKERIKKLLGSNEIDENRMAQELAIISDRVDTSEEIVRFKSHLKLFSDTLEKDVPVGKKLNFILQEMHRELNTFGVKTSLIEVSHTVVRMKEEVEKLREQIQNIE